MKTDLDRTKEFLDSLGVLYGEELNAENPTDGRLVEKTIVFGNHQYNDDVFPECDKVSGYTGFFTRFEFDNNGKFLTVGA